MAPARPPPRRVPSTPLRDVVVVGVTQLATPVALALDLAAVGATIGSLGLLGPVLCSLAP